MKIDQDNPICKAYIEANPLPHPERQILNELNQLIEKQKVVQRITIKRKATPTTESSSPKQKKQKKKKKKKRTQPILRDEDSETESDPNVRKVQSLHPSPHNSPISQPITS